MKKKLLTILLSVFMIMATFAVNVFADEPATIEQLFNTYAPNFPKAIDSTVPDKAWISSNNKCYISQDNDLIFDSGSGYSSLPVAEEISRIVDTNNFKCNYFNIIFNIENGKLISIERDYTEGSSSLNGIYTAKVTIADILPDDFPTTSASGWINENGARSYKTVTGGIPQLALEADSKYGPKLSSLVTKNGNEYINNDGFGNLVKFVMNNGTLKEIVVSGTGYDGTDYAGTYVPFTIADILPNDFPTSEANAWHNKSNNALKAYISNNELKIGNTTLGLNEYPSKDSDTKYSCQDIVFNLDQSGKLISIVMSISMNNDNGTYAPMTISDILPADFPTTSASGWIKENYSTKNRIYKNSQNLMIGTSSFPLNGVVTKDGNNYKYQNGMIYINFIMDSNVLNKINFLVMSVTASGDYIPYKYTNDPISIIAGSTSDIEFVTNAVYTNDSDVIVRIDNNLTPLTLNQDYTLSSGSTHVTLKGKYVSTLAAGKHTIAIAVVGDDEYSSISQEFTVTLPEVPDTGVYGTNLDNYSLLKLSSLSLLAIGTYLVIKKKKDN